MGWRFVVAELNGRSLGEPFAYDRKISGLGVSRTALASFRIRRGDPLFGAIRPAEAMLKAYDPLDALRFYGPIVATDEAGEGQGSTLAVSAADLSWRLGQRLIGKDTTGDGRNAFVVSTDTEAAVIAHNALAAVNAEEATGITAGTRDTTVVRQVTYTWKRMLDLLNELGAIAGSYEWQLRYTDGAPPIVNLDLKLRIGTDRQTGVFFEYGTGKANCGSYRRTVSADVQATDVYGLPSGQSVTPAYAFDTNARTRYGRSEDAVAFSDITITALLDALAAAHVTARRAPRETVEVTPFQSAPQIMVDYEPGDTVTTRVKLGSSDVRFAGAARVWAADVAIDEQGNAATTLNLQPS